MTQTRLNNKMLDTRTLEVHLGGCRCMLKCSLTEGKTNSRGRLEGRKESILCCNYNEFCCTTIRRRVGIVKSSKQMFFVSGSHIEGCELPYPRRKVAY